MADKKKPEPGGSGSDGQTTKPWEFTTRLDKYGYPKVVAIQPLHFPSSSEMDESMPGLGLPPQPTPTRRSITYRPSIIGSDGDEAIQTRRLTVTPRQVVHRMSIFEAFSDSVSRAYRPHSHMIKQQKLPSIEKYFPEFVTIPFSAEVVPDPKHSKHAWIHSSSDLLYFFWMFDVFLGAILNALTMFIGAFLPDELHSTRILKKTFLDSDYINLIAFIVAHFFVCLLGIAFLCYPSRYSWGTFHKLRWILMGIPNVVLVIGILEQLHNIINFRGMSHELTEIMEVELVVTKSTTLAWKTQAFFKCCGVQGYKDWEPLIANNDTIYNGGYPKTCCNNRYIKSCSLPVNAVIPLEPTMRPYNQLWPYGCYSYEAWLLFMTASLIWLTIIFMAIATIAATVYLWWVIRHINVHDIEIDHHPFHG